MGTREIQIRGGLFALVDDEEFQRLSQYTWRLHRQGYATRGGGCGNFMMHHEVFGKPPKGFMVDHINGNKLDNRRANLRLATKSQNNANSVPRRSASKSSSFKGVSWNEAAQGWRAQIQKDGKGRVIGLFADEVAAAYAYDLAAVETFGDFARPNFPDVPLVTKRAVVAERQCGRHKRRSLRGAS